MIPVDLLPQFTTNMTKPFYTKPVKFYTSYWYLSSRAVLSNKQKNQKMHYTLPWTYFSASKHWSELCKLEASMLKTGPLYGQYDNEKGNEHTGKLNKITMLLLSAVKLTCTLPTDHIQYNSGIFCVQSNKWDSYVTSPTSTGKVYWDVENLDFHPFSTLYSAVLIFPFFWLAHPEHQT